MESGNLNDKNMNIKFSNKNSISKIDSYSEKINNLDKVTLDKLTDTSNTSSSQTKNLNLGVLSNGNSNITSQLINNSSNDYYNVKKTHLGSNFVKEIEKFYISETIKISLITGPLYCLSGQFQYLKNNINSNIINKVSVGTKFCAFRCNQFNKYFDLIQYNMKQGILSFYKGNLLRLSFFISTVNLKKHVELSYDKSLSNFFLINKKKFLKEIILFSFVDIILNPLLFAETRYMLQDRRRNYSIYNNLFSLIKHSYKDLYKASFISFYRNVFFVIGINFYFISPNSLFNVISVFLSHALSYPFLTIQRNIMLTSKHSNTYPNFYYEKNVIDNNNNNNIFNKINNLTRHKDIFYYFKHTNIFQLYRGFPLYISAIGIWHLYVPKSAKKKYYDNLL